MNRWVETADVFADAVEKLACEVAFSVGEKWGCKARHDGDFLLVEVVGNSPVGPIRIPRSWEWECSEQPEELGRRVRERVEACLRISHPRI